MLSFLMTIQAVLAMDGRVLGFDHRVEIAYCRQVEYERLGRMSDQPRTTAPELRHVTPPLSGEVKVRAVVDAMGAPWFPSLALNTTGSETLASCVVATFDNVRYPATGEGYEATTAVGFGEGIHVRPSAEEQLRQAREQFPEVEPCLADRRARVEGAVLVTVWRLDDLAADFEECLAPVVRAEDMVFIRLASVRGAFDHATAEYWELWDTTLDAPRDEKTLRKLARLSTEIEVAQETIEADNATFAAVSAFLDATRETIRAFNTQVVAMRCEDRGSYVGTDTASRAAFIAACKKGIVPADVTEDEEEP